MIVIQNMVHIDKTVAEPVYQQLSNGISDMIRQGLLQPGEALPSSRKLAEAFDLHRKTVIAAFDELQAEGWAESLPRKGLFVSLQLPVTKPRSMAAAKTMTVYPSQTAYGVERKQYVFETDFVAKREKLVLNDGFPDTRLAPIDLLIREYRRFGN